MKKIPKYQKILTSKNSQDLKEEIKHTNKWNNQPEKIQKPQKQRKPQLIMALTTLIATTSQCLLKYHPPYPASYSALDSLTPLPFSPSLPLEMSLTYPNFPTTLPCPVNTFLNRSSCLCVKCHSNCAECSGPTARDCIGCKTDTKLKDGGFYGLSSCWEDSCGNLNQGANSKFLDRVEGICKPCDTTQGGIKECLGGAKDDATVCNSGFNLVEGRCIEECTAGNKFYDDKLFYKCYSCHADCASCNGNQKSDCLACGTNKILKFGYCFSVTGGACPSSQFFELKTVTCQPCHSSCLTCDFHSKNCLTCQAGDFLYQERCYNSCPVGTYPDGNICKKGVENCIEFSGNQCLMCQNNLVLKQDGSECITKSTGRYFLNEKKRQSDCDLRCTTSCVNGYANGCSECDNYLKEGVCQDCDINQYHSHINKNCYDCHASCKTCYQATMFSCLTCPSGKTLYNDGSCGTSCNSNQYPESYFTGCKDCHPSCETCSNGEVDGCKTCPTGSIFVEGNRCIQECQSGWFLMNEKIGCVKCHESCQECKPETGHLQGNCLSCKSGYLEHITSEELSSGKYINPTKKFCSDEPGCASGYFMYNSTSCVNHKIPDCHYSNSKTQCYKCKPGLVAKFDGSCKQYCEDKKYPLVNHTTCATVASDSCTLNCEQCSSIELRGCLVCKSGFYLTPDRTCKSQPPIGFFIKAGLVTQCQFSCASCLDESFNSCLSCLHTPLYNLVIQDTSAQKGICVSPCPDSFSAVNGVCKECHGSCLRCNIFLGETDSWKGCIECYSDKVLRADGQCHNNCPTYWYVGPSRKCRPCHSSCKTCFGDFDTNCLSCKSNKLLISDTGRCQSNCPSNQYYIDNKICYPCDPTCATCGGSTSSDCKSCFPPQVLNVDGTCQPTCAGGSFEASNSICEVCADLCKTCTSNVVSDCSECVSGVFKAFPTNLCTPNCTVYYYPSGINDCLPCNKNCYSCSGPLDNDCSTCDAGVIFNKDDGTCGCNDAFYLGDHKCNPCHDTCGTCTGPKITDCVTCNPSLVHNPDGSCTENCADEFFDLYGKCTKCHKNCLTCTGTTEFECDSCHSSYYFLTAAGNCLDCEDPLNAVMDCQFVKDIKIVEEKDDNDIFSSNTLEIIFEGQLDYGSYLKKLSNEELIQMVKISANVEGFTFKFRLSAEEEKTQTEEAKRRVLQDSSGLVRIFLDINTTFAGLAPVTITATPVKLHWREPPLDNRLSFRSNETILQIFSMKPEDSSQLKNAENLGKSMDTVGSAMEIIGVVSIFMSLVSVGAPSGPIIKIIRLFKVFFRLRLVNVEFGLVLDFFLSKMGEMMKTSSYKFNDLDRLYSTKTRGKLSKNEVTIFSGFVLYDKLILYLLLRLAGISSSRLKSNVKDPHNLTTFDFYYVKLIDSLKALIILSGIYDFTLYCSHEILHHDVTIEQVATVKISYFQACLCLSLVVVELLFMFRGIQTLDADFIIKFEEKIEGLQKIIRNKFKKRKKREKAKERMGYFMRRFDYKLGAMNKFFIEGIKGEKLKSSTGRYFRYFMMVKLVFFELVIVSLQMLPKLQITLLSLAELLIIVLICKALFYNKIYANCIFGVMDLLTELTIMFFFVIGMINTYSEKQNAINPDFFMKLQVMVIWMILSVSGLNILQVIYHGYLSFQKFLQKRKLKIRKGEGFAEQLEQARQREEGDKNEDEGEGKKKKKKKKKRKSKLFGRKKGVNRVLPSEMISEKRDLGENRVIHVGGGFKDGLQGKVMTQRKKDKKIQDTADKFITDDDWMVLSKGSSKFGK